MIDRTTRRIANVFIFNPFLSLSARIQLGLCSLFLGRTIAKLRQGEEHRENGDEAARRSRSGRLLVAGKSVLQPWTGVAVARSVRAEFQRDRTITSS
jgi:hypothetical protein